MKIIIGQALGIDIILEDASVDKKGKEAIRDFQNRAYLVAQIVSKIVTFVPKNLDRDCPTVF